VTPTSVHPGLVEDAVQATLKAWLPSHLERVARENGLPPRSLPAPRSWPVASEFDLRAEEQLPAVTAVLWNDGLGGLADEVRLGPDNLAVGNVGRNARAVFGAAFEIYVPDSVAARPVEEPLTPPADPVPAPPEPGRVETVEITLEVEAQ
jgi:hypothetical protein